MEAKFQQNKVGAMQGSVLITGNKSASDAELDLEYTEALKSRIHSEVLCKPHGVAVPTKEELKKMRSEGIGFAILTNALFLTSRGEWKVPIPRAFRSNAYYSPFSDYYAFVGNEILKDLVKWIDTGSILG